MQRRTQGPWASSVVRTEPSGVVGSPAPGLPSSCPTLTETWAGRPHEDLAPYSNLTLNCARGPAATAACPDRGRSQWRERP